MDEFEGGGATDSDYPLQRYPVVEASLRALLTLLAAVVLALLAVAAPPLELYTGVLSVALLAYAVLTIRDAKVKTGEW